MSAQSSRPPPSSLGSDFARGPASRHIPLTTFAGTRPPEDGPRALDVRDVSVAFGKKVVLSHVSFHVPVGEFLCLSGPNGAGKSTLLKCILGLVTPTSGRIVLNGRDITSPADLVAAVWSCGAGHAVEITVTRDGVATTLVGELAAMPVNA